MPIIPLICPALPSVYWSQSGSYLFVMPSYAAILPNGAPEQKKTDSIFRFPKRLMVNSQWLIIFFLLRWQSHAYPNVSLVLQSRLYSINFHILYQKKKVSNCLFEHPYSLWLLKSLCFMVNCTFKLPPIVQCGNDLVFFRGSPGFGDLLSIISLCPSIRLRRCGTVFSQKLGSSTGRSAGSWVKRGGTHKRNFLSVMATSSADGWFAYRFYPFFLALWALSKSSTFHFVWVVLSELISCQDGYIRPMKSPRAKAPFRPCSIDQEIYMFHRVHCYD